MASDSQETKLNPPDFIRKLLEMIQGNSEIISFSSDGVEVVINDYDLFVAKLLPHYFRHGQWRSFIRQMNMYNFKKINRGVKTFIFVNPLFFRGNEKSFHKIKRKLTKKLLQTDGKRNTEEEVKGLIEADYGVGSLSQFMSTITSFKQAVEKSCSKTKKNIDFIWKERKNNEYKTNIAAIKESIQLIEETSCRLHEAMENYKNSDHTKTVKSSNSFDNRNSGLKTNSMGQHFAHFKAAASNHQNIFYSERFLRNNSPMPFFRQNPQRNALGVTSLCSFNSVTNLINLS